MSQCSLPRTERRWSRAFGWSAVCSVAGAGSWLLCLLASRWVFGPWSWFEADAEQTAIASGTYGIAFGGWGLLVGAIAGRRTRRGIVRPALALAATGGFAGLLLPILVFLTRSRVSPDLGSSLAFALAGSVAGLIAGRRANARQPSEEHCYWAVASAVAAGGSWAITAWVVQSFFEFRITQRFDLTLSQHVTFLTGIGAAWGILGGGFVGLRCKRNIAMWSASGAAIGALTGSVLSLLESVEVGQPWLAITSLMVGIAGLATGWTAYRDPEKSAVGMTALPGVTSSPESVPDTVTSPSPECKEDPR